MTVSIQLINTAISTFQNVFDKLNLIINAIANSVVTVDTTANGSFSQGNGFVNGIFSSNTLSCNVLRGGNVQSNGVLDIFANTLFLGNSVANAFANSTYLRTSQIVVGNTSNGFSCNTSSITLNGTTYTSIQSSVTVANSGTSIGSEPTINFQANGVSLLTFDNVAQNRIDVRIGIPPNLSVNTSTTVGNDSVNTVVNATSITVVNVFATNVFATYLNVGSGGVIANATQLTFLTLAAGNTIANLIANSILVTVANATGTANLQPTQLVIGSSTINSTAYVAGANVFLNTTKLSVGNSIANLTANSILVSVANATSTLNLQPTQIVLGSASVNTTAFIAGANVFLDTTKLSVGNTIANLVANSILVTVANASGIANLQPTQLVIGGSVVNSTSYAAGANVFLSTTSLSIGNDVANTFANSTQVNTKTFSAIVNSSVGFLANTGTIRLNGKNYTNLDPYIVVSNSGATIGTRPQINFIGGSGASVDVTDQSGSNWVDVQIAINTAAISLGVIGGANTQVQFNDSGAFNGHSGLLYDKTSQTLTVGSVLLVPNASITELLLPQTKFDNLYVNTSVTTSVVLDSFFLADFRAGEYLISIKDNNANAFQMSKLLILHDGGIATMTEYGTIVTNTNIGVFTASTNATHALLNYTAGATNNTSIKVTRTLMSV